MTDKEIIREFQGLLCTMDELLLRLDALFKTDNDAVVLKSDVEKIFQQTLGEYIEQRDNK